MLKTHVAADADDVTAVTVEGAAVVAIDETAVDVPTGAVEPAPAPVAAPLTTTPTQDESGPAWTTKGAA